MYVNYGNSDIINGYEKSETRDKVNKWIVGDLYLTP